MPSKLAYPTQNSLFHRDEVGEESLLHLSNKPPTAPSKKKTELPVSQFVNIDVLSWY